jgi:hypothetical protein
VSARHLLLVVAGLALVSSLGGCGGSASTRVAPQPAAVPSARGVRVAFVGQDIWFVAPDRRWKLEGVTKSEVVWSPDGTRLAYAKPHRGARWRIYVRDQAGAPVNEFAAYRDGQPAGIEFRNDRRLAYEIAGDDAPQPLVPVREGHRILVEHDVVSGEIVAVRRGRHFVWSPDHRHMAYIRAGAPPKGERLHVDDGRVYPRETGRLKVLSRPSWSPDGRSIAFLIKGVPDQGAKGKRRRRRARAAASTKPRTLLVVVLELHDASGDMTWEVPPPTDPAERLEVFWAGNSRVVVGPEQLKPRFSASWRRER